MRELDGKVAVITGAASGIGQALAAHAAARGMRVVLADIDEPALGAATTELTVQGAEALAVPTDVTRPEALDHLRDATLSAFGAAHLVCNNAGVGGGGATWEAPLELWRWVLDVDLWGVLHGVRAFTPALLEQGEGHVVNTASIAGLVSIPRLGPYNVAKHGVVALTESLRQDLAGTGVSASVLCPGFVRTRIHESERVMPPELQSLLTRRPAGEDEIEARQLVQALVEGGMDAGDVARAVFEGVQQDRLHIFTHPESGAWVQAATQAMIDGTAPQPML